MYVRARTRWSRTSIVRSMSESDQHSGSYGEGENWVAREQHAVIAQAELAAQVSQAVDPDGRAENREVHGEVVAAVGLPLPGSWVRCNLKDTIWPKEFDISGMEFIDCDLSGSNWDQVHAS